MPDIARVLADAGGSESQPLPFTFRRRERSKETDSDIVTVSEKAPLGQTLLGHPSMSVLGGVMEWGEYTRETEGGAGGRGLMWMRGKALKEQTDGMGLRSQLEVEGPREEVVAGEVSWPPTLNESSMTTISGARAAPSPPAEATWASLSSASKAWGPPAQSPASSLLWLCRLPSNQHTGQAYPTSAYQSSIMALWDLKSLFSPLIQL